MRKISEILVASRKCTYAWLGRPRKGFGHFATKQVLGIPGKSSIF